MGAKISKTMLILCIAAALILTAFAAFLQGFHYVQTQDKRLTRLNEAYEESGKAMVTEETPGAVAVFIPRSADMDEITKILKDHDIISNSFLFRFLSKFNGFDNSYQAGTHYLLKNMSYDEIMFILTRQPDPLKITFVEGETYLQMRDKLVEAGLNIDVRRMDDLVRHPNEFLDYPFVRELSANPEREWLLQGYLWPDTYWFDPNLDEVGILRMFLDNTQKKLSENDYSSRAARMNMSMDQVITIASIVQAEGNIEEMSKIGRVFLNRFELKMPMESCATINYLRSEEGEKPIPWATNADLQKYRNNPYNTYANPGLPPGPINNPGTLAIEGILWPANEDSWPGASQYLYFCATGDGSNVFATNAEEHQANIEYYRNAWEEGNTTEKTVEETTPEAYYDPEIGQMVSPEGETVPAENVSDETEP